MASIQTPFSRLLSIELPIVQAPIGSATCPALAAAVSEAGGLGMLAMSWRDIDEIREIIRETRELTIRPFGVNLVLEWPQHERLQACLEEGVKIVSFFWGDPVPYIQAAHGAGAIVIHTVGSAAEARRSVDRGVDVIVAQGWEAGGHVWGEVASLPLIPQIVDAVAPVPVVAAGGIADGRGLAAALMLGASGIWMGTRFLASKEAAVHPLYKEKVLQAAEVDAVYCRLFDIGWPNAPHRVLRNSTVSCWEAAGCPPSDHRPGEGEVAFFDPAEVLSVIREARKETVELIRSLTNDQLRRTGVFDGYGHLTVKGLIHYLCSHDQQHLAGMQWLLGKIESHGALESG
ncbi:MAG TPA: nitronate monooxygenase [Pyrinomonadaceae bacterium]|nr:nitronate monooxygenase [Pyrinomonadaceae bacterium]